MTSLNLLAVLAAAASSFLSRAWTQAPQYQETAKRRIAGAKSNIIYLDGLPPRKS